MSDLLERLRGRGWRLTAQRRVVAEVLDGDHVHYTAVTAIPRLNSTDEKLEWGISTLKAVKNARGMNSYDAKVKKK